MSIVTWFRLDEILAGATIAWICGGRLDERLRKFAAAPNRFFSYERRWIYPGRRLTARRPQGLRNNDGAVRMAASENPAGSSNQSRGIGMPSAAEPP